MWYVSYESVTNGGGSNKEPKPDKRTQKIIRGVPGIHVCCDNKLLCQVTLKTLRINRIILWNPKMQHVYHNVFCLWQIFSSYGEISKEAIISQILYETNIITLKQINNSCFVFWRSCVWVSIWMPAIVTEVSHGFPQLLAMMP